MNVAALPDELSRWALEISRAVSHLFLLLEGETFGLPAGEDMSRGEFVLLLVRWRRLDYGLFAPRDDTVMRISVRRWFMDHHSTGLKKGTTRVQRVLYC